MSRPEDPAEQATQRAGSLPICEFCGCYIEGDEDCPALDGARCHP